MTTPQEAPLNGVRVIDLTSVVMGPLATQVLGDLGADVIAIEPRDGDTLRRIGAGPVEGFSGAALNLLRNKRSIALDLKQPDGRAVAWRLLEQADVFVTNLRPGSVRRLGFTYDELATVNSQLVVCHAHGWASDDERADDPAYDDVIQAGAGVPTLMEQVWGVPGLLPTVVADKVCGLTIAYAVSAALVRRATTGVGGEIEVPMSDVTRAFMLVEHGGAAVPSPPQGPAGYPRILTRHRRAKRVADGSIYVMPYTEAHWSELFISAGREDLVDDRLTTAARRHAHADELYAELQEVHLDWTVGRWEKFCAERSIPFTIVPTLDEVVAAMPEREHPVAGSYRHVPFPVRFPGSVAAPARPAPGCGENTLDVLRDAGYGPEEIDALHSCGAVISNP